MCELKTSNLSQDYNLSFDRQSDFFQSEDMIMAILSAFFICHAKVRKLTLFSLFVFTQGLSQQRDCAPIDGSSHLSIFFWFAPTHSIHLAQWFSIVHFTLEIKQYTLLAFSFYIFWQLSYFCYFLPVSQSLQPNIFLHCNYFCVTTYHTFLFLIMKICHPS